MVFVSYCMLSALRHCTREPGMVVLVYLLASFCLGASWSQRRPLDIPGSESAQPGRVFSVSDSQSGSPGFKSRGDHYLDLFLSSPEIKSFATLVNSQLICLQPVGILNNVMFSLDYLFLISCLLTPLVLVL